MAISVAITGVSARLGRHPDPSRRGVRIQLKHDYLGVGRLTANPATGILGSEIPNNSPPRINSPESYRPPSAEAA